MTNPNMHMAGPWITQSEIDTVVDALQNGWYENAYDYVEKFQPAFAAYHHRAHGLMTPNCTAAIHLVLKALDIGPGDEVIVPECTWIATSAPISYLGATPVFADIEEQTWCLDPASLESKITPQTKAIIVVDLYGNMPQMNELLAIAEQHRIPVIEDAAEALGSCYQQKKAGQFGLASVFSFHRTKTLTTGEGGMLLTDSDELKNRCAFLRDHGRQAGEHYFNTEVAYKYMPFNVQAALGYAQLQRVDELVAKKRQIFKWYHDRLANIPDIQLNPEGENTFNSYWATTLVWEKNQDVTKKQMLAKLQSKNLPARPFFYPLSSLPAYQHLNQGKAQTNPVAYDIANRGINLPSALNLQEDQIDAYCNSLRSVLA